jgi:hypothetical protein
MRRSVREQPAYHRIRTGADHSVLVCELLSDMGFTGAEAVVRDVSARLDGVRNVILDLSRVGQLETVAILLLEAFTRQLPDYGIHPAAIDPRHRTLLGPRIPEYPALEAALPPS